MSYRPVDEAFWTDPKVRLLSANEKMLFLYFITNPHANFTGLYYLPLPTLLFETGFSEKEYRKGIDTLSNGYQVLSDEPNSLFWVVKMAKFQVVSTKQIEGVRKHIKTLQKSPLIGKFAERYPDFINPAEYPIDTLSDGYRYPTDTTETETETKTQTETKPSRPSAEEVIPSNLQNPNFIEAWESWKQYRTEIKHKMTPSTANALLKKFSEWGPDRSIVAIRHTIEMGWQGIREPEGKQKTLEQIEKEKDPYYVEPVY